MEEAYRLSAEIVDQDTKAKEGVGLKAWQKASGFSIIVVPGEYDTAEAVLDALDLSYEQRDPGEFDGLKLRTSDVVVVNCPGEGFSPAGLAALREHVAAGGLLITTDWALKHVVESAFPGFVEHNGAETEEEFVDVRVTDKVVDYLKDLIAPGLQPVWWLEGGSYPIRILNSNVRTLLVSRGMKEKYADPTVACIIHYGRGRVLHMTSHLFLQNAAPLDSSDGSALPGAIQRMDVDPSTAARVAEACKDGTRSKAIEAAYVLERLLIRVLQHHLKPR
ncbi:MAG: hypothetical protein JW839_05430 [Candidatus Lokiarchaeota archaeon]|nr:hypothetical protein [Candidatus Lokiarchaeota archaeon]